jgi:hypothetical protein
MASTRVYSTASTYVQLLRHESKTLFSLNITKAHQLPGTAMPAYSSSLLRRLPPWPFRDHWSSRRQKHSHPCPARPTAAAVRLRMLLDSLRLDRYRSILLVCSSFVTEFDKLQQWAQAFSAASSSTDDVSKRRRRSWLAYPGMDMVQTLGC